MNSRITTVVVSTYSNTNEIMVYFYRDLDEFPKKAYSIDNTFWHRVRYNRVVNALLDAGRIKLTEQHVGLGGTFEMIFVPVETVKPSLLNDVKFANEDTFEQDEW